MIEPLQYNKEYHPAYEIARPVFCHACLCQKNSRLDPNIAIKFCSKCPSTLGADKEYGAFLCASCDESNHKPAITKDHIRQIVVVGPGVRKKVAVRGDGFNFPLPLDRITIKLSSRIYQNGRRVHRIHSKEVSFISGMSGRCLHVQVLGARNLMVGDLNGSSDPYIVYSFCGKPLGTTRVRPRSTNPRWDNETFIVPMDENLPTPRDMPQSQKDLVRLEVYDYDWVSNSEFLGHVEITRSKLMKIAAISNQMPIRLPLTMKEYHGFVNLQFGYDENYLHVKAVRAENLNLMHASTLSNPYIKIYMGNSYLVGTTTTLSQTLNPHWHSGNAFKIRLLQYMFAERYALSQIDAYNETQERLARSRGDNSRSYQSGSASQMMDDFSELPTNLALFRVEIYHEDRWRKHQLLGKSFISVHKLRKMLPTLPAADVANMSGYGDYVVSTARADKLSAKLQADEEQQSGWCSKLQCWGKKRIRSRPNSPEVGDAGGGLGRIRPTSPGAGGIAGMPPPSISNRRRGNLLGAASAGGASFPVPQGANAEPARGFQPPPSQPSPVPYPPSVRPAPPGVPSATSTDSFNASYRNDVAGLGGIAMAGGLSSRRRQPLTISVSSESGSFGDPSSKVASPVLPSGKREMAPETSPSNPQLGEEGMDGDSLPSHRSQESKSDSEQEPSEAALPTPFGTLQNPFAFEGGGSPTVEGGGSLVEGGGSLVEGGGSSVERGGSQAEVAGSLVSAASMDSWEQPHTFPRGQQPMQGETELAAFEPPRSARPAPPPLSTIADLSYSAVTSSAPEGDASESHTMMSRAPFLQQSENSSNTLMTRKSKRTLMSLSFRAPEVEWSESHPFPVMLDTGAHRGVDAFGKPISQGFVVLRLIPATRGAVVLGLDEAVRQMTLGETAVVKCRYDYAYGSFSMGSNIPPRANVVFKVKLLEINGRGRYQVLYRMIIRFMRWISRFFAAVMRYWLGDEDEVDKAQGGQPSKKLKRAPSMSMRFLQSIGLSSRGGTAGSDSESSESSESEQEDEDGDFGGGGGANADGDGGADGESEDGSSVDSQAQTERRVKPDPRMRKHLNPSVQSGAQLMWNFKPPAKVKKPKAAPKKPLYPVKKLAPVAEQKAEGEGEQEEGKGESDGEGLRSDDEDAPFLDPREQYPNNTHSNIRNLGGGLDFDDGYGLDGGAASAPEEQDRNESDDEDE